MKHPLLEEARSLVEAAGDRRDRGRDGLAFDGLSVALLQVIAYLEREVAPDRQEPEKPSAQKRDWERVRDYGPFTAKALAVQYDVNVAALIERIEDYLDQKSISSPAAADSFRLLGYEPEFVRELLIGLGFK